MNLSDDEIHRRAVAQALVTLPDPTDEQAHDAVCVAIKTLTSSFWNRYDNSGVEEPEILTDIRRLEHATRLLRQGSGEIARLRIALSFYAEENNWRNEEIDVGPGNMPIPDSSECARDAGGMAREVLKQWTI